MEDYVCGGIEVVVPAEAQVPSEVVAVEVEAAAEWYGRAVGGARLEPAGPEGAAGATGADRRERRGPAGVGYAPACVDRAWRGRGTPPPPPQSSSGRDRPVAAVLGVQRTAPHPASRTGTCAHDTDIFSRENEYARGSPKSLAASATDLERTSFPRDSPLNSGRIPRDPLRYCSTVISDQMTRVRRCLLSLKSVIIDIRLLKYLNPNDVVQTLVSVWVTAGVGQSDRRKTCRL